MNLPKKDKNGNSYLSYSQIATFKKSKEDFYNRYILNEKFIGNDYTDFGSKVGEALENNDFSKFDKKQSDILKSVTRLDLFERKTILKYDGFYLIGFIDTCSNDLSRIIDYKTGGVGKDAQYSLSEYNQLHLYALSLRQETGITPVNASVEFITRKGNAFKGESLYVGDAEPIKIPIDISIKNLTSVYWDTLKTAKEIEVFYENNMP